MAIEHATSGQVFDVQPLAGKLAEARTAAIFKTEELEVMRLILPAHKTMPSHLVKGDITVQCLEGEVDFIADGKTQRLKAGQMLWLEGGVAHSLTGVRDASLLVTIVLRK